MNSMVSLRGVSKTFGDFTALHPTDLEIAKGEFVTLLGPSGSGKTTLLNLIAGSIDATSGSIWLQDRDVSNLPARKRDLGMVFQNYALFPHMTVFDNIAFPLMLRRKPKQEIKVAVERALELVSLAHVAQRKPKELSGGQQQRIAIARALIYEPKLILMDEPLGALDRKLRESLQYEIKQLHEELHMTVLYVTHDQEEALTMSDRICLMNGGKIEQLGTPKDMYFQPATRFAADFLGISNITTATVAGEKSLIFADDFRLDGVAMEAAQAGETVTVTIRPEALLVEQRQTGASAGIGAIIEDIVFLGSATHLMLKLGTGERFIAKLLTRRSDQSFSIGDEVRVSFTAVDVVPMQRQAKKVASSN